MKKFVSILLVVVLTMTSLSAGLVGFAETYTPDKSAGRIFLSVTSEKDKYAWGDELVFIVSANNNTESDYKNVKIRAQANKAKFFYDGESNTETIDYIKAGETKEIQIKVKASSPNVFQRMFILPIYYIIDFLSPMAFNANNYDTTMLVKVGAFRYKFGFDVTDGEKNELDVQNNEALEDYERILQMLDKDDNGCADCIENNDYITDTDGDELPDYYELVNCYTNPLLVDTDGDGVDDAYADLDRDGLSNHQELINSTNPTNMDTDKDGLNDGEELFRIHTAPLKVDTDGDGAYDGTEVEIGTNPLIAESTFDVKKTAGNEDGVRATVEVALSGEQVESLNVEPVNNKVLFPETIPGYLGAAYDFSVNGTFSEAKISFEFNEEKNIGNDFDPIIYYFNEAEQRLEALETTIAGNVASAVVKHFSTYILINRAVYESAFDWIDVWSSDENYSAVELVLIIDDSGSMSWNDSDNQRLTVAKNLIDKLPENSKIGIVKFESGVSALTSSLIVEKDSAKAYLTTSYFRSSGGTRMYTGIQSGLSLFGANEDTTLKIAVVLSDGETDDTSMHSSIINTAKEKKVKVYTVGLGNSTSYFNNYLKPLASSTGGAFYLADNASQLSVIYEDIGNKIDISVDSDIDGVPDYYEDNMVAFNGVRLTLDKNNPDSDGDGLLDGEEVKLKYEYNEENTRIKVTGRMISDPTCKDGDRDGFDDDIDPTPILPEVFANMIDYYNLYYKDKCAVTIFLRQPIWDSRTCYTFKNGSFTKDGYWEEGKSGHGFWGTYDGTFGGEGEVYCGFGGDTSEFGTSSAYPLTAITRKKIPGEWYDNEPVRFSVGKSFEVSKEGLEKIKSFKNKHINDDYHISENNCTTMAVNMLKACGVNPQIYKHTWTANNALGVATWTYYGYSPADAAQDIKENYSNYLVFCRYKLKNGKQISAYRPVVTGGHGGHSF